MNSLWLNKNNSTKCILFFNGWGMDENAVNHMDNNDFDICMFYNYNKINKVNIDVRSYQQIYVVAWSLGVWAAAQVIHQSGLNYSKAIAVNGTLLPKHDEFGIPISIFETTLKTWNERNREKFNMRAFGGKDQLINSQKHLPKMSCDVQIDELAAINNKIESAAPKQIVFDCSLIGSNDLIFSRKNQHNYWADKSRIIEIEMPHFPFGEFASWENIIEL